ncbi:uncharacterized protein BDR25DRAFT_349562 [Lindgomyces ingoldianus]|uniref:Uncharacterized protein n=1 Tax=Lindgomyces ingoldianus TaxID=673940 RepID=A0ACB6RD82_9PLEO|nr:uncharacterized protein BDR25DRAFT_349562 [Lindgomyces ingoldianus]KAF2476472.1 hypothetical protein BDR25DRAFT_349562 [Lindgomyces ingoldianus]
MGIGWILVWDFAFGAVLVYHPIIFFWRPTAFEGVHSPFSQPHMVGTGPPLRWPLPRRRDIDDQTDMLDDAPKTRSNTLQQRQQAMDGWVNGCIAWLSSSFIRASILHRGRKKAQTGSWNADGAFNISRRPVWVQDDGPWRMCNARCGVKTACSSRAPSQSGERQGPMNLRLTGAANYELSKLSCKPTCWAAPPALALRRHLADAPASSANLPPLTTARVFHDAALVSTAQPLSAPAIAAGVAGGSQTRPPPVSVNSPRQHAKARASSASSALSRSFMARRPLRSSSPCHALVNTSSRSALFLHRLEAETHRAASAPPLHAASRHVSALPFNFNFQDSSPSNQTHVIFC